MKNLYKMIFSLYNLKSNTEKDIAAEGELRTESSERISYKP